MGRPNRRPLARFERFTQPSRQAVHPAQLRGLPRRDQAPGVVACLQPGGQTALPVRAPGHGWDHQAGSEEWAVLGETTLQNGPGLNRGPSAIGEILEKYPNQKLVALARMSAGILAAMRWIWE